MSNSDFKVDEGKHPIPTERRPYKYPWDTMKIGDSFDFPIDKRNSVATAASWYSKRHSGKCKFTVRTVDEKTGRCWRIL